MSSYLPQLIGSRLASLGSLVFPQAPPQVPSLPPHIKKTRQIYKLQTHKVVQWVISTSGNKDSAGAASTNTENPYRPLISLAVFTAKVNAIAEARVPVPSEILACFANIIRFRKICAAFYSTDEDAWKGNRGHRHVISVYIDAFLKLGGKTGAENTRKKGDEYLSSAVGVPATEDGEPSFLEVTLALQLREKTGKTGTFENERLRDDPMIQASTQQQPETFPLEDYGISDDNVENGPDAVMMAVIGFFCDLAKIRKYCKRVWNQVEPAGKISRVSASLVTTQAVELVRKLESDLMAEWPAKIRNDEDIYEIIGPHLQKLDPEVKAAGEEGILVHSWCALRDFTTVLTNDHVPVTKVCVPVSALLVILNLTVFQEGFFGYYNPENRRRKMTPQQRRDEDRCVLLNYLPEMCVLYSAAPEPHTVGIQPPHHFIGDDGFGLAFKPYYQNRHHPITLHLVFATQMVLDILYTRRDANFDDRKTMRTFYRKVTGEIDTVLTNPSFAPPQNMTNFFEAMHGRRKALDAEMGTDLMSEYKKANGWGKLATIEKDIIWTRNPWLATNAMTYALVQYWDIGATLCLGANFPQSVVELWNFLKQLGYLKEFLAKHRAPETLLPEYLITNFSEQLFTRGRPTTSDFILQTFMQNGTQAPVYNYQPGDKLTGTGISPHISEVYNLYSSPNGLNYELDRITRKQKVERTKKGAAGAVGTQVRKDPLMDVDEHFLLYPLASTLKLAQTELKDTPVIGLDAFKMHHKCYEFLDRLWEKEKKGICEAMGQKVEQMMERKNQLPYVTMYLMMSVFLQERKGGNVKRMDLLRRVAKMLVEVVGRWTVEEFVVKV